MMIEPTLMDEAIGAASWVTCSPHEWNWTHDQQVAMARYIMLASHQLDLWRWLTEMRCTVWESASEGGPQWVVSDVDDETLGVGNSPEAAIEAAKQGRD
jgi:hypothetical protein